MKYFQKYPNLLKNIVNGANKEKIIENIRKNLLLLLKKILYFWNFNNKNKLNIILILMILTKII
jgi:hypothetical protein